MTQTHTPGPWATRPIYGSLPDQAHAVFWQDDQRSRRLDDGGVFKAGDAALIAAAPDLLAALKDAAASIEVQAATARHRAKAGDNATANNGLAGELERNAEYYRAAIAKAEGRS